MCPADINGVPAAIHGSNGAFVVECADNTCSTHLDPSNTLVHLYLCSPHVPCNRSRNRECTQLTNLSAGGLRLNKSLSASAPTAALNCFSLAAAFCLLSSDAAQVPFQSAASTRCMKMVNTCNQQVYCYAGHQCSVCASSSLSCRVLSAS